MGMYLEPFQAGNVAYCNRVPPLPCPAKRNFSHFFLFGPSFGFLSSEFRPFKLLDGRRSERRFRKLVRETYVGGTRSTANGRNSGRRSSASCQ